MPEPRKKRDLMSEEQVAKCEDYQYVFGSESGQRVLEDLAVNLGHYSNNLGADAQQTAHNCGRESAYLYIQKILAQSKQLEQQVEGEVDNG